MHELSIAENILDILRDNVPAEDRPLVRTVRLQIGDQAGIVIDSLMFSFEALIRDTPFSGARMEVEKIPFTIHCDACGRDATPGDALRTCPHCGSLQTRVTGGTDMRVVDVELDERNDDERHHH